LKNNYLYFDKKNIKELSIGQTIVCSAIHRCQYWLQLMKRCETAQYS